MSVGPCAYHARPRQYEDPYYARKIVRNEVQPAASYLSESELNAVVRGRYRGDGRRVDAYVLFDPLQIDLD